MAPAIEASSSPMSPPARHSAKASASTKPSTLPSEKPSVLSTASSGIRSRTLCAMVLPTTSSRVKNTANRIQRTMRPMSPICLTKLTLKSRSVWVLVSSAEFEHGIDRARHLLCVAALGELEDVEILAPLHAELVGLVQIVLLNERQVGAFFPVVVLAIEDAHQVEGPCLAAVLLRVDIGLDRNFLANLPTILVGELLAGDHAGTCMNEGLPVCLRHHPLRVDITIPLGVESQHDERGVLLPDAAEPGLVGDTRHAG